MTAAGIVWFGIACYAVALAVATGVACGLGTCTAAAEAAGDRWAAFGFPSVPASLILAGVGVYRWGAGRSMRRSAATTASHVHRRRGRRAVLLGIALPLLLWMVLWAGMFVRDVT